MKTIAGTIAAVILLGILISQAGMQEIWHAVSLMRGIYIPLLLLLQLITLCAAAYLWYKPIQGSGGKVTYPQVLTIHLASGFVESITPSVKFGGEAAKIYLLKKASGLPLKKVADAAVNNAYVWMVPFAALCGLTIIIASFQTDLPPVVHGTFLLLVFCMAVGFPLYYHRRAGSYVLDSRRMLMGISLVMWILYPAKTMLAAQALGITQITFTAAMAATFCAYLVGLLPLLPGGLGGFEAAMVIILSYFGIPLAEGAAIALTTRLFTFWFPLLLSACAGGCILTGSNARLFHMKESP